MIASGCVIASRSLQPLRSRWWAANCCAAVVGLAELELLDHGAHRAVENGDAAGEELAKLAKGRGRSDFVHW